MCWPDAQLQAAMRLYAELHREEQDGTGRVYHDGTWKVWSQKPSLATPFRFDDGVRFFMSPVDLAPWDEWTTDPDASPEKPEGWGESAGEQAPDQ